MSKQEIDRFLDLERAVTSNDSIKFWRYEDYLPQESSNLNTNVPITIRVNNVDNYFLLEQSCFIFDLELVKKSNGLRYTGTELINIVNNGPMFLFNQATLRFGNEVIENYLNVGQATLVQGLLRYSDGFSSNRGHTQCWSLDDDEYSATLDKNPGYANRHDLLFKCNSTSNKGNVRFMIPFSHIFGFNGKILSGLQVSVQLERVINDNVIFKSSTQTTANVDDVVDGIVNIKSMKWRIPYVELNTNMSATISSYLTTQPKIPFKFVFKQVEEFPVDQAKIFNRNLTTVSGPEKILGFVVIFQTNRLNSQKTNISVFDNCDVLNASISLNNVSYPGINLYSGKEGLAFIENYDRYVKFRELFTHKEPEISPYGFQTAYPMYCFDTTRQEDRINGLTLSVKINFQFNTTIPAGTNAYVITFRERFMSVSTSGDRKMIIEQLNTY